MSARERLIPRQPEVNIGTAGHVDHGKTTLVEAITGIWTSAHSEELKRGITIRVGYADAAFYKCPNCPSPDRYSPYPRCPNCGSETTLLRVVSFVDCPGHESLMANMLSGAAVMDGAILVIAANEQVPQPQTREHLLALEMLGMRHIVIVQNKVELIDDQKALESYHAIKRFTAGTVAENAAIIPISAQNRINIDAVIEAIETHIPTPKRETQAPPFMQILRSFDVNKPGIKVQDLKGGVVGGTLLRGELKVGDDIEIRPGLIEEKAKPLFTKIKSLGTSAGLVDSVRPGGLIAIGTSLDPVLTKSDSLLGCVVGHPNTLPPILDSLTMYVQLFETAVGSPELVKVEKIRSGEVLRLNIGTAVTLGNVSASKENAVEVNLRRPVCADKGAKVAISRRIGDRWRLIGAGTIT
ncbi:MAG: translation initiation factor IF-2 subunit gamma [Nitrososphaerales archaeon]